MRKPTNLNCAVCGEPFLGASPGAKYCCAECRRKGKREVTRMWSLQKRIEKRKKMEEEKKKPKPLSIPEIAKEARAAGMFYGEYVAKKGL